MRDKWRERPWYPYAVAACIGVTLFVVLTHLSPILKAVNTFLGYFSALFLGAVLAYLMNPLAKLYDRTVWKWIRNRKVRWVFSVALALITVLMAVVLLLVILIPQLISSISMLLDNMDGYLASLEELTEELGISEALNLDALFASSSDLLATAMSILKDNTTKIISVSTAAGRTLAETLIAVILSVYLLIAKSSIKTGIFRLLRAILPEKSYGKTTGFLKRCDDILSRYIVYTLLDALIVGVANLIFMTAFRMQYAPLVSLVVAVTNLIPSFGPVIGGVIGGFILLLVNPTHALIFIIFTMVLQFLDGYVIKPKLFGDSLGVSGVLILAAVIVFGNIFGIVGMLFAIPLAAILDFLYNDELLPMLERRQKAAKETGKK